jgi:hypothetical protein
VRNSASSGICPHSPVDVLFSDDAQRQALRISKPDVMVEVPRSFVTLTKPRHSELGRRLEFFR